MKKNELIFNIYLVAIDYLMLVGAGIAAYGLRMSPLLKNWRAATAFFEQFSFSIYLPAVLFIASVWVIIFAFAGLYQTKINQGTFEDFVKILISCSAGVMMVAVIIFFRQDLFDSRFIVLASWFFALLFVTTGRLAARAIWRGGNFGYRKIALVGEKDILRQIKLELEKNPYLCSRVVSEFYDLKNDNWQNELKRAPIDEIIICDPECSRKDIVRAANYCEENQIDFRFIPDLYQAFFSNVNVQTIAGFPILELRRTPLEGWGRFAKRASDVCIGFIGMIVLIPIWAVVAVAIKIDSPGPALVKLKRVSRGKEFYLYKFRSMKNNTHDFKKNLLSRNERNDGPLFKLKNDPRITRVGKFIRATWIDEFPQLINVLNGEMSLVGPRPHEPEEVDKYQNRHKRVFFVKSGMTGLAQISGSCNLKFEEEIKLDLYYIKNWSMIWDLKILLKTAVLFLKNKKDC